MFKAILLNKHGRGLEARLAELDESQLPEGDVTVSVECSSLNHKDGLAITGKSSVVRHYPMIPGIDLAGVVESSSHPDWKCGDKVLINGWGIGESHWGGLAQKARVKGKWLTAIPEGLSPRQSMAIGTAGYTAMLCVMGLERQGIAPEDGEILVTGANGGIGSIAVTLLAMLGFTVVASTGRIEESAQLKALGAARVIDRQEFSWPGRPLGKERWIGAIDSLGSHTLANVCAGLKYRGVAIACGLAQGMDFPATVAPFILRGITLVGIDSVHTPVEERKEAWRRLAKLLDPEKLESVTQVIGLSEIIPKADELLSGWVRGRIVVDVHQ
ncbi:MAG: oxidoreductase [Methylococcaceae bacterium]|nr:oxidoreductase [Methylococcaceae bacterium]